MVQNKDSMYPPISRLVATKNGRYIQSSKTENGLGAIGFLMLPGTVLATEVEWTMLQDSMCIIRHMMLTSSKIVQLGSNKVNFGDLLD